MLIVTHFNPDIDAICSVWLLKKFGPPEFNNAAIAFVPAGNTYQDEPVDSNPEVVHVDTGLGQYDHHQCNNDQECAASLVLANIKQPLSKLNREALERIVQVVCDIDHFKECLWDQAEADFYSFMIMSILEGLKLDNELDDQGLIDFGSVCLTGIFQSMKHKIRAENDLGEGIKHQTAWGKSIFLESGNTGTLHLAQKKGYNLVVRKDPRLGLVKIGVRPDSDRDISRIYDTLKKKDNKADWYLHSSKRLLLNGSTKNPKMKPSTLKLVELIDIIKNIK